MDGWVEVHLALVTGDVDDQVSREAMRFRVLQQ